MVMEITGNTINGNESINITEYDNLFGTQTADFWTNPTGGTSYFGGGRVTITGDTNRYAVSNQVRTAKDIRTIGMRIIQFSLSVNSVSIVSNTSTTERYASGSATIRLWDGAGNQSVIASASSSDNPTNTTSFGGGAFGDVQANVVLVLNGPLITIYTYGSSVNTYVENSGSGSSSSTLIASGTVVDTTTWTNVYIDLASSGGCYTGMNTGQYHHGTAMISYLTMTPTLLGSKGTKVQP